jgi:hypothetical protein
MRYVRCAGTFDFPARLVSMLIYASRSSSAAANENAEYPS